MPKTPDASFVTQFRRVNATVPNAPVKKSRTFDAPTKQGYLSAVLRTTDEGRSIVFQQSLLQIPAWKSPQFNGRFFVK
jgi:hypothetical protein